jgi:hypothetical protein
VLAGGRWRTCWVIGREVFARKSVPLAELFSRTGRQRLMPITCGGSFDRVARW